MTTGYPEDCKRIRSVVQLMTPRRDKLSLEEAQTARKNYSQSLFAGWIMLPKEDSTLFKCIRPFLPRCEQCGAERPWLALKDNSNEKV